MPCTNTSWGSLTGRNPSYGNDWLKKGCLGKGSDSCVKSGSQLNMQTGQLVSQVHILLYPSHFCRRKWPFKSMHSGAEGDNTEGLNNYVFPFSRISTTQQP